MEIVWTDRQTDAITINGDTLLVSAGAGSGKTAVLVERLLRNIEDERVGADIDSFLVLTFANAAANEMKEKIAKTIEKKLDKNPENEFLRRQLTLLHNARISTIHSFLAEIVRENFHRLKIAPDFKIADGNELELMMNDILSELFDTYYAEEENEAFVTFLNMFSSMRGDDGARDLILNLYRKLISNLSYKGSLTKFQAMFEVKKDTPAERTTWGQLLISYAKDVVKYLLTMAKKQEKVLLCADEKLQKAYLNPVQEDVFALSGLDAVIEEGIFNQIYLHLETYAFSRLGSARGLADDPVAIGTKAVRDLQKKHIKKLKEDIFYMESAGFLEDIEKISPVIACICRILTDFHDLFLQEKAKRNLCDFNDLEHMALWVLTDEKGEKSEVALQVSKRFLEILVDEYQDTNEIQDKIFSLISRDEKNIFMVGDVKQSIYQFRQARPDIFLHKYLRFSSDKDSKGPKKVSLNSNFRSRREIIDLVNSLFCDLMSSKLGDIDYTEEEYLRFGAKYYPQDDSGAYKPELLLLDMPPVLKVADEEQEEDGFSADELEAMLVAKRIRSLIDTRFMVFDAKTQKQRPVTYRDITVLMRSVEGRAPLYEKIFSDFGIPAFSDSFDSYFGTTEVMVMFALLKVIDNPLQDIPLVSVMRSSLFSFTEDEILQIRKTDPKAYLYELIKEQAVLGDQKCTDLAEKVEKYRRFAAHFSTDRLIWYIYEDTGFYDMAGAMKNGDACRLNLRMLFEYARYYESTTYRGLYNFINFVNKIIERKGDFAGIKSVSENSDAVRVMSIHKSKGLEFSVCILSQTGSVFNYTDLRNPMIFDAKLGFGPQFKDIERKINYPTLAKRALMVKKEQEMLSEELRIFYVAMTRAKEKLIITGKMRNIADKVLSFPSVAVRRGKVFDPVLLRSGRPSYLQWILQSLCDGEGVIQKMMSGERNIETPTVTVRLFEEADIVCPTIETREVKEEFDMSSYRDNAFYNQAKKVLSFSYPHAVLCKTPAKISVTELKGKMVESEILEYTDIKERFLPAVFKKPDFLQEDTMSAAQKGTAAHLVMQYIDYNQVNTKEDIEEEIARLQQKQLISVREGTCVDRNLLLRFFQSETAKRIKKAKRVWREERFNLGLYRREIYGPSGFAEDDKKMILIQGVMDCFFEESDGKVVLLDYKTDKLTAEDYNEIIKRYGTSMKLYKMAIEKIYKKEVKESYIYLLNVSEAVKV